MKTLLIPAVLSLCLAACGGGGGSSPAPGGPTPTAPVTTPATTPVRTTVNTTATVASAPAVPSSAINMSSANVNVSSTGKMDMLVKYAGTANMTLNGSNLGAWISDNQAMGTVTVTGSANTVVFKPGATVSSLNVQPGNTVYLPAGSPIQVAGGATVLYYTN
jgi:hypothetical protein